MDIENDRMLRRISQLRYNIGDRVMLNWQNPGYSRYPDEIGKVADIQFDEFFIWTLIELEDGTIKRTAHSECITKLEV